jgi:hypothetical protein
VFGTLAAVEQGLSAGGGKSNTAFIARRNLDIRHQVAAGGRRVRTVCQGADGWHQQLALSPSYSNFGVPPRRFRPP